MAALQDKSRDSNGYEMFSLIYVLVEFSLILAAVVSRFKYRLPRFPDARHIYDEQAGFDFAAMTALFGIFFILIVTILALFFLQRLIWFSGGSISCVKDIVYSAYSSWARFYGFRQLYLCWLIPIKIYTRKANSDWGAACFTQCFP